MIRSSMMKDKREIWIFAEFKDGRITKGFEELLCKSRNLFEIGATVVSAVVLGNSVEDQIAQVKEYGVDKVYAVEHMKLTEYNCDYYKVAMEYLIKKHNPDIILFGATVIGAELAPSVAARMRTGLAAHCVDITAEEEKVSFWVPAFGGNVIGEILIPDNTPQMASVKPGILGVFDYVKSECTEIFKEEVPELDHKQSVVELVGFTPKDKSGVSLEDAEIVVCAGRGVTSEETWKKLNEFATRIHASVGYTRSLIDRGFVEDETNMIGTSGKSIKPNIYIGIGVSGATHHVCGMNKSKTIININKDSNAKIFEISDYKVGAKSEDILTALLEKI